MILSSVPASSYNATTTINDILLGAIHVYSTHLVQASQHMREIQHRVPIFIDLMEDIVTEELDDVSVTSLRPPGIAGKPDRV